MAKESSKAFGSQVICQVGLIVRDIERSSAAYADLFHAVPRLKGSEYYSLNSQNLAKLIHAYVIRCGNSPISGDPVISAGVLRL